MKDCNHRDIMLNGSLCRDCGEVLRLIDLQLRVEELEAFIERDAEYIRKIRSKKIKLKKQVEELEQGARHYTEQTHKARMERDIALSDYHDLLDEVADKYENESRHERAKHIIRVYEGQALHTKAKAPASQAVQTEENVQDEEQVTTAQVKEAMSKVMGIARRCIGRSQTPYHEIIELGQQVGVKAAWYGGNHTQQEEVHMGSPTPAEWKKGHLVEVPYEPCPKCGYKVDDLVSQLQHNRTCTEQSEMEAQGGCEASLADGLDEYFRSPNKEPKDQWGDKPKGFSDPNHECSYSMIKEGDSIKLVCKCGDVYTEPTDEDPCGNELKVGDNVKVLSGDPSQEQLVNMVGKIERMHDGKIYIDLDQSHFFFAYELKKVVYVG